VAKLNPYQTKLVLLFTFAAFAAIKDCFTQEFGAQDFRWYEGFMLSAAGSLFYTPQLFAEYSHLTQEKGSEK